MNIIEALKNGDHNLRLSNGNSWLTYYNDMWCVSRREYGQRKTRILMETDLLDVAIEKLLED